MTDRLIVRRGYIKECIVKKKEMIVPLVSSIPEMFSSLFILFHPHILIYIRKS